MHTARTVRTRRPLPAVLDRLDAPGAVAVGIEEPRAVVEKADRRVGGLAAAANRFLRDLRERARRDRPQRVIALFVVADANGDALLVGLDHQIARAAGLAGLRVRAQLDVRILALDREI